MNAGFSPPPSPVFLSHPDFVSCDSKELENTLQPLVPLALQALYSCSMPPVTCDRKWLQCLPLMCPLGCPPVGAVQKAVEKCHGMC